MPPSVSVAAFVFGMVLVLAAIVGKDLKIAAIEMPALSRGTRLLAGLTGLVLLYVGLFDPIKPAAPSPPPADATPTVSVSPTATTVPPTPTVLLPTATDLPIDSPRPTAISAATTPAAFAVFSNLRVIHNVVDPGTNQYGMELFANFTITGYQGKLCRAVAYFFDANMTPLRDLNGQYRTDTFEVATAADFTPGFDPAEYSGVNELRLFIPYSELHLLRGTHNLFAGVKIYGLPSLEVVGQSGTVPFQVIQN